MCKRELQGRKVEIWDNLVVISNINILRVA